MSMYVRRVFAVFEVIPGCVNDFSKSSITTVIVEGIFKTSRLDLRHDILLDFELMSFAFLINLPMK